MASPRKLLDRLDLSTFIKNHNSNDFIRVQKYLSKLFSGVADIKEVISSYRNGLESKAFVAYYHLESLERNLYIRTPRSTPIQDEIRWLFFQSWILLALVPQEKERSLTIGRICLTKYQKEQDFKTREDVEISPWILKQMHSKIGKGVLVVEHLTVVCTTEALCDTRKLREELSSFANITINSCKLKVIITPTVFIKNRLEELSVEPPDELKLMIGDESNGVRMNIGTVSIPYDELEELDADIPLVGDDYVSPHRMFGGCYDEYGAPVISVLQCQQLTANGILIATLGYGYDSNISKCLSGNRNYPRGITVKCDHNFVNDTAPVYNSYLTSADIIDDFTKTTPFVICQTTYCDGTIANGATSKAINWLRKEWKETWKREYDNLVVLIPYGGGYREDEMEAITRATDEGIIIVCAAGSTNEGVVFPAAYGNVISVGIAGTGPIGREIDVCIDYSNDVERDIEIMPYVIKNYISSTGKGCIGKAAAEITGLLSLLLSRINSLLRSCINKDMTESIKRVPGYLHTCVIRELLMNDGIGSHNPQEGYGDGRKILLELLLVDDNQLMSKIANVVLRRHMERKRKIPTHKEVEHSLIDKKTRCLYYHNLTGRGIKVAVVDSDFRDTNDGHGDTCMKIVRGISSEATLIDVRDNYGTIVQGFNESLSSDHSIDIISCSMGTESFDLNVSKAVGKAILAGKIIVFSAGNEGRRFHNSIMYPAHIGNVLVVGGRDSFDSHLSFSSVGKELDFLAPAELGSRTGTSYAAPVVAGYIALLLEFIKEMSEEDYRVVVWKDNQWSPVSIWKAAHNVYAIRNLLKLMISKPQVHSEVSGFGCLDFSVLFPSYRLRPNVDGQGFVQEIAKKKILTTLQTLYCRQPYAIMTNVYSLELLFSDMHI